LWFTSDNHFSHVRINELAGRPFSSVEEGNEVMVENWNRVVSPTDDVWVIGDFVMGQKSETLSIVSRLNGNIFLVPGNHDGVFSQSKKREEWKIKYNDVGITILPEQMTIKINGLMVDVCHFPYRGDSHFEDRYADLRPPDNGRFLIHGE
jgi:calcineurin-like phosphoesterase family protein